MLQQSAVSGGTGFSAVNRPTLDLLMLILKDREFRRSVVLLTNSIDRRFFQELALHCAFSNCPLFTRKFVYRDTP